LRYPFIIFDWGDTIMKDCPDLKAPMYRWPRVEAVEGAEEVLRALYPTRTISLATGSAYSDEDEIRWALARVNLDQYFDKIYCFLNTGYDKQTEAFYWHILDDLHASPPQVIMVGDSLKKDVIAPNRVGIRAVWFNRQTQESRQGDLYSTIHSLPDLLPLLTKP
jgi:FMN phosphatase YigB (HAD superfamily)